MEKVKITIFPSFIKGVFTAFTIILLGAIMIFACEDVRIGKTKEELAKEMFEVDSLLKTIHLQIDSAFVDFNKFYINAQRINNGSN
jgi:hypothetical protein